MLKTHSAFVKRFDGGMGNGIGFNDFLILYQLNQTSDQKMRRVDLAEKIGMTASGITRLLLPLEKIGLIKNGPASKDARVRHVAISDGGKEKFEEALERLNYLFEDIMPDVNKKNIKQVSDLLFDIGGRVLMN